MLPSLLPSVGQQSILHSCYAHSSVAEFGLQSSVPSAIGARHTAIRYLQSHECIEKLKRNMREEHVLKLDWISTLFKHVSFCLPLPAAEGISIHCMVVARATQCLDVSAFNQVAGWQTLVQNISILYMFWHCIHRSSFAMCHL